MMYKIAYELIVNKQIYILEVGAKKQILLALTTYLIYYLNLLMVIKVYNVMGKVDYQTMYSLWYPLNEQYKKIIHHNILSEL